MYAFCYHGTVYCSTHAVMLKDIGADKGKAYLGVMFPETRLHIIDQASNRKILCFCLAGLFYN